MSPENAVRPVTPTRPKVKILDKDGKELHDITPDTPITIAVYIDKAHASAASSIEVTVTTDRGDPATVTLPFRFEEKDGGVSYWGGPFQLGRGFGEKYYQGKDKPELIDVGSTNGGGGTITYGGLATGFSWYPDELQQAIGVNEKFIQFVKTFLLRAQLELVGLPKDPEVDEVRRQLKDKLAVVDAIQKQLADASQWPRAQLHMSEVALRYLTTQGPIDIREFYRDMSNAREQGEREGKDETWHGMGEFVIGGYAAFVNATGAGSLWTMLFGQDIFGNEVGWKERFFAGLDLAFQAAMLGAGVWLSGLWRVPRTSARISRAEYRRPAKGVHPTKAAEGAHVTSEEFGMLKAAQRHVQFVCDSEGVTIQVRPTNPDAMRWRALGHPGKPMAIKAKTINELDVHLGAKKENVGLVGYFEPKRPTRTPEMSDAEWAKVEQRYTQRAEEFTDYGPKMQHLEHDGLIKIEDGVVIDTGICGGGKGGSGLGITGDHDLWRITDANGNPLPPDQLARVVGKLKSGPYGAQHGAHTDWKIEPDSPTYATDKKVDTKIRAEHTPSAQGGEGVGVITFRGRTGAPQVGYEGGTNPAKLWKPTRAGPAGRPGASAAVRTGAGAAAAAAGLAGGKGAVADGGGVTAPGQPTTSTGQAAAPGAGFDPSTDVEGGDLASDTPSAANPVGPDTDDLEDGLMKGFAGMGGPAPETLRRGGATAETPPARRRTVETDMADAWDRQPTRTPTPPPASAAAAPQTPAASLVETVAPFLERLSTAMRVLASGVLVLAGLGLGAAAAPKTEHLASGGVPQSPAPSKAPPPQGGGGGGPTAPPTPGASGPSTSSTLVVDPIIATFVRPVTSYSVKATSSSGDTLGYVWSKTHERDCGLFSGSGPFATWSHPDPPCPNEDIHPGTISVVVTDAHGHSVTAQYPGGSGVGTGPRPATASDAPTAAPPGSVAQQTIVDTAGGSSGSRGVAGVGLVMVAVGVAVAVGVRKKHCDCEQEMKDLQAAREARDSTREARDLARQAVDKADHELYSANDAVDQAQKSLASAEQGLADAQKYVADLQSFIDQAGHALGPSAKAGGISHGAPRTAPEAPAGDAPPLPALERAVHGSLASAKAELPSAQRELADAEREHSVLAEEPRSADAAPGAGPESERLPEARALAHASTARAASRLAAAQRRVSELQEHIAQAEKVGSNIAEHVSTAAKAGWQQIGNSGYYAKDGQTMAAVANAVRMSATTLISTGQGAGIAVADQYSLLRMAMQKAKSDLPQAQADVTGAEQNVAANKQNVVGAKDAAAKAKHELGDAKDSLRTAEKSLAKAEQALDRAGQMLTGCQNRPKDTPCPRHG